MGASQLAGILETKYCQLEVERSTSDNQPKTNVTSPPLLVSEQVIPQPGAQASEFEVTKVNTHLSVEIIPQPFQLCPLPSLQVFPLTPPPSLLT